MKVRRTILPASLVLAGIVILIGCIPIPSTRQFQPNGKLRPEHAIGRETGKPIRLEHTRIDDAFVEISRRISGQYQNSGLFEGGGIVDPLEAFKSWRVSPDHRHFMVVYEVRTTSWLAPFCFSTWAESEARLLTLDVNAAGVVTGTSTSVYSPPLPAMQPQDWLEVFDAPTRRKLHNAGVFPEDGFLREDSRRRNP